MEIPILYDQRDDILAPIALFCYKRPTHLKLVLEALAKNSLASRSTLFIFCDGPKEDLDDPAISEVRIIAKEATGFGRVEVRCSALNLGLAKSIITGVSEIVEKFGRIIVLEDDLVTSPHFLTFMNEALTRYANIESVASIHGYVYPVGNQLPETFFLRGTDCWGWATWSRAWSQFVEDGNVLLRRLLETGQGDEFDLGGAYPYQRMLEDQIAGRNNSWAIRWHASVFLNGGLTLYPGRSLVLNIGLDSTGTHSRKTDSFEGRISITPIQIQTIPIEPSQTALNAFASFFRTNDGGRIRHFLRKTIGRWPKLRTILMTARKRGNWYNFGRKSY